MVDGLADEAIVKLSAVVLVIKVSRERGRLHARHGADNIQNAIESTPASIRVWNQFITVSALPERGNATFYHEVSLSFEPFKQTRNSACNAAFRLS